LGRPLVSTNAAKLAFASLASALVAVAALVLAGAGTAARTAALANSVTFQDSSGEDAAAPDISTLVVSNDNQGNITFTINMPNRPTLDADMLVLVQLDTDANAATGDPEVLGSDYAIELDGPFSGRAEVGLFRWTGSEYSANGVPQTSLVFAYTNGAATIRINARELGATKKFNFGAISVAGVVLLPTGEPNFDNIHVDLAPDAGHGFYSYEVKTTPPSLAMRAAGSAPARPRAGRTWSVFSTVTRVDTGDAVTSGRVTCRALVGGRTIIGRGSFAGGRARCSFTVPASAKGKRLRGTMTVVSGGLRASRGFNAVVA
jgi:hypothetical protein